nr:uncharacterized protein CTRU02_05426 [Colletotrichum truncatum]KAF6793869.1 hypothetical protein CTRU02_05426 [Colletotrichum truncatum]
MSYYTQITADDYTYEDGSSYDQAGLFGTPLDPTDVASFATSPSVIDLEDAQTIASSRLSRPPEHVTITNVIPAQAAQPGQLNLPTPLEISGLQDVAIEKYCDWLCSRVQRQNFKNQYRKAAELALDHCLDLEGLHDKQDVEFFTSNGIQLGAARCFITSIRKWAELQCDA